MQVGTTASDSRALKPIGCQYMGEDISKKDTVTQPFVKTDMLYGSMLQNLS